MTPRPRHIICSSLNHHYRCCSKQKCPYIMIPSLFTSSPILILRQVSTVDFYSFYIIFAPPWTTPGPHHIIYSGLNHHFRCRSMQKCPYKMIPSMFTPSPILFLCLFSTMHFHWFCFIFAPPWTTPGPRHIICSGLNHHIRCWSMQKDPYIMFPSLLSHSLSSITRLISTMDFYWFCLILAPPWETPWPCHIFCSGFIHHSMRPSIQPDLFIMTLAILITFLTFNNQTGPKLKISIFFASIVHPHGWPHDPATSIFLSD